MTVNVDMQELEQIVARPKVQTVDAVLEEREKTHGRFDHVAYIYCGLKGVLGGDLNIATSEERTAVDMILMKLARIHAGQSSYKDHWEDIAGYATLISRGL